MKFTVLPRVAAITSTTTAPSTLKPAAAMVAPVRNRRESPGRKRAAHSARMAARTENARNDGGWYRVRTCDPCRVKAVLYR